MSHPGVPLAAAAVPLLACDALRIGHRGQALLPPLHWQVRPGELWAIVGVNGSGKTTLLRTLLGLHPAVGGRCLRARAGRVAYVGQLHPFADEAPLRVVDLVRGGALRGNASLLGWARRLGKGATQTLLAEFDLVALAERRYHELSCGQQQRVLLARALASAPDLLCLDEPTSAMDAATAAQTLRRLRDLVRRRNLAALVVGHQLAPLLEAASHVLWLRGEAPQIQLGPATSLRQQVLGEAVGLAGSWADARGRGGQRDHDHHPAPPTQASEAATPRSRRHVRDGATVAVPRRR